MYTCVPMLLGALRRTINWVRVGWPKDHPLLESLPIVALWALPISPGLGGSSFPFCCVLIVGSVALTCSLLLSMTYAWQLATTGMER